MFLCPRFMGRRRMKAACKGLGGVCRFELDALRVGKNSPKKQQASVFAEAFF